ncbi:TetR/AcrR family transcriptional regulator [Roseicyclus mahoneyensis]|jgi:AcrR family transcriptional regulator|uniref:TetR family transcriptional regulator n=1 Tax=Roseicyclus mahoneyensis TaxID=164332 RepID=A0A316GEY9_9RHOB|nr:TetR/AcrR family transcriptional regulator [Roseicyclus mahoneyensis]PWK59153.1 TetR family transcriptional regulator [Roseicyclus mahoneyensis]
MSKSPQAQTRPGYHHGDLRAQLIAAVRDLVETHGPEGFSVAEAARRAGVSSAAPYKHFKDRPELLRAVVSEAMDRLHAAMARGAAAHAPGSLEAIAAIGMAYVDFARGEPGVFRLVFGLTEGHEEDAELIEKGESCLGVVVQAVAVRMGLAPDHATVARKAYMLWAFVHGHSFLTIDMKNKDMGTDTDDWTYLLEISRAVLGPG